MLSEGEDVILSPTEQREALRVQRELLSVMHADGEARTRNADRAAPSLLNQATIFFVGALIGALATFSALTGRIATVEATLAQHGSAIAELKQGAEEVRASNREILGILRASSDARPDVITRRK